eukprot:SAG11_NODE_345_length_10432_cov_276.637956_1_plen_148_part_00
MCDYIRQEFQREDSLNDLLLKYKNLKQGSMKIRDFTTLRDKQRTVLENLGITFDPWMEKSAWLESISDHLQRTIRKESHCGYYALSIKQMTEIAKGEEDAQALANGKSAYRPQPQFRSNARNFALVGKTSTPKKRVSNAALTSNIHI